MCGICGVLDTNFLGQREIDVFRGLSYISVFRGYDSTGYFSVEKDVDTKGWNLENVVTPSIKDKVPSYVMLGRAEKAGFFNEPYKKRALVGHSRAATIGSKTADNAHPFEFDNVIGVHNGTISRSFRHSKDFDTDSQALYKLINEGGITYALNEVSKASPAYALVWYDKLTGCMNFVRNIERPLFFTYYYQRKTLLFASAVWMLEGMAEQFRLLNEGFKGNASKIFFPKEHELFSFDLINSETFANPERKQLNIKKPSAVYYGKYSGLGGEYNWAPWAEDVDQKSVNADYGNELASKAVPHKPETYNEQNKRHDKTAHSHNGNPKNSLPPAGLNIFDHVMTYQGHKIHRNFFTKLLSTKGCAICSEKYDPKTPGIELKCHWYDQNNFVCDECYFSKENGEWVRGMYFDDEKEKKVSVPSIN